MLARPLDLCERPIRDETEPAALGVLHAARGRQEDDLRAGHPA
jgi:hypothetical protein